MKRFKLFFLVVILFFTSSCSKPTEENVFYEVQKYFNKIETYRCIVDVTVTGNKDTETYKAKHIFKKPNKYVIEILEPLENKGNITLYDGKQAWLYNKQVDESFIIKDLEQSLDKSLFVGYFLRSISTNERISMYFEEIEDKKYLVLEADIPGNNKHRSMEKLWIDSANYQPYKLVIYKDNGEIFTKVDYSEFKANVKIYDEDFNIKTGVNYFRKL